MSRAKPVEQRQGHANVRSLRPVERGADVDVPPAPEGLGEYGAALWAELWVAGGGAYQPSTDRHIVERYCHLLERRRGLLATLTDEGWVAVGSMGQQVLHPAAKLVDQIEGRLGPMEDRLGLSPESRLRLGLQSVEHQSRLDAFLDRRR